MSSENTPGTKDDLFKDATADVRAEIKTHLENARNELPTADEVWEIDSPNILGALNALQASLDIEDAAAELHEAQKRYVLADRADAFDSNDSLGNELDELTSLLETLSESQEQVSTLTASLPEVKQTLEGTTEENLSDDESVTDQDNVTDSSENESEEETRTTDDSEESLEDNDETETVEEDVPVVESPN